MSHSNERGAAERGLRSSALWGTGSRGGDSRSSVLWGKGGRGIATMCVAVFALAAPLAATAAPGKGKNPAPAAVPTSATAAPAPIVQAGDTYVAKDLLDKAKTKPNEKVRVIIQSKAGTDAAEDAFKRLNAGGDRKRLNLVDGV